MADNWSERLKSFADGAAESGVYELVQSVGNTRSAKSTVYQLSKRFPEFLWEYKGNCVHVFIPQEEPLKKKAIKKWKLGAEERSLPDTWPPDLKTFQGNPYSDSLEELADLYNYIVVAERSNTITEKNANKIIHSTQALYNLIRRSFEVENVEGIGRANQADEG